ncbi:hypothetical protein [Acinetobacter sp.]|uniref:hypothetical protein n=1 Tax=Acinetobacter sp. TaxID=472 RepID=UPI00388D1936
MITFKQYLSEQDIQDISAEILLNTFISEEEMNEVEKLIKRDCAPFLREAKGAGFLYRGVKGLDKVDAHFVNDFEGKELLYSIKHVRKDRKPLSSSDFMHKVIDDWFNEKFNFKARSTAMFVVGEGARPNVISGYGTPCVVFPIGEIQYAWSPAVRDLYISLPEFSDEEDVDERIKKIRAKLDQYDYQTNALNEVIPTNPPIEIMMQCDKYYAFPIKYKEQLQISLDIMP